MRPGTAQLGRAAAAAGLALALAACAHRPTRPVERFITPNGVRLEVLDWGGPAGATGLVFIHGLDDSPHAFDDIAPAFNDRYRVIAYARRAHARSEVKGPYDNATLTEDLKQLLDSLHIAKAVLVGWSLGGTEESGLALRHPDRVAGLVLLETYNYGDGSIRALQAHAPAALGGLKPDTSSAAAFREYWRQSATPNGSLTPAMDSEIADVVLPNPNGTVHIVTTDSINAAMLNGAIDWHADWSRIRVPVLGLWGRPTVGGGVRAGAPDSVLSADAAFIRDWLRPFQDSSLAYFRRAMPSAKLIVLDSGIHAIFPFEYHDTIIAEMRRFMR